MRHVRESEVLKPGFRGVLEIYLLRYFLGLFYDTSRLKLRLRYIVVSIRKLYVKKRIVEERYMVVYLSSWLIIDWILRRSRIGGFR